MAADDDIFHATDQYLTNGNLTSRPELKDTLQELERTVVDDSPIVDLLKEFDSDDQERGMITCALSPTVREKIDVMALHFSSVCSFFFTTLFASVYGRFSSSTRLSP